MRLAEHRRSARARHGRSHRAEAPSAELSAAASGGRGRGLPPAGLPGAGVPGVGRCVPCDRQGLRDANGLWERNIKWFCDRTGDLCQHQCGGRGCL